jgi:hypothetical protein
MWHGICKWWREVWKITTKFYEDWTAQESKDLVFFNNLFVSKPLLEWEHNFLSFTVVTPSTNLNFEICLFKHNLGRMTNNSLFLLTRSVSIFFEEEMLSVYRARLSRFVSFTCNHGIKSLWRLGKFKCKTSKISTTSCLPSHNWKSKKKKIKKVKKKRFYCLFVYWKVIFLKKLNF